MNTWLNIFQHKYKQLLSNQAANGFKRGLKTNVYNRGDGFEIIFNELFKIKESNFQIIETGTVRNPNNWKDGNSGLLFTELVKIHGGYVQSVDINPTAVNTANKFISSDYYKAYCSDSVSWLESLTTLKNIDLFYLDSYDVKWSNDKPSAQHHLKEFLAIEPYLNNCIVAIDDNAFKLDGTRTGKGRAIVEYLDKKGIHPIYDNYQIIYRF